jgi:hypothetical protein
MPTWSGPKAATLWAIDMQRMLKDLTVDERQDITHIMGREAEKATRSVVMRTFGSKRGFSGWRRKKTVPINTRLIDGRKGATIMAPTKSSAGVATTAQFGRNPGGGGLGARSSPRMVGPRLTKTGKISKARVRRYNGTTQPMRTSDKAVKEAERRVPRVTDRAVRRVVAKRFDVT